ncbi:MAG TPA: hypothetical protein VF405_06760 [Gammaproteobacteria bacterium]
MKTANTTMSPLGLACHLRRVASQRMRKLHQRTSSGPAPAASCGKPPAYSPTIRSLNGRSSATP